MKKSCLLEYMIKKTDELYYDITKSHVSIDAFVTLFLTMACDKEKVPVPEGGESFSEMVRMKKICATRRIDLEKAYRDMSASLVKPDGAGDFSLDALMFSKLLYETERKAESARMEILTAGDVFNEIIENPTEAVKKYVLENVKKDEVPQENTEQENTAQEPPQENAEQQSVPQESADSAHDEKADASLEDFLKSLAARKEKKGGTDGENEPEGSGLKSLLESVGKVKNIQKTLLDRVYGQDSAVSAFVEGVFQAELISITKVAHNKPKATYLFAGPPGVGKTFLAEQAAEVLDLPYKRFDMSEYADKEANIEFCGSDRVYKNAKEGNVTGFVAENPKCIILFDEVEKAHPVVTHLFLQILDAGRIRDNYTDEEVSFKDAILIFTTNAGRQLYDDPSYADLSGVPRKTVIQALGKDINPSTGEPLFPQAICSRFASGNVLMFNRLGASYLLKIVDREIKKHSEAFEKSTGIKIDIDKKLAGAIMFSEGGKADARAVSGKASNFLYKELYELFRLMASEKNRFDIDKLEKVKIGVELPQNENIKKLFAEEPNPDVLLFASGKTAEECERKLAGFNVHIAETVEEAKNILFAHDITVILADVLCNAEERGGVLNIEDVKSAGRDFLEYAGERVNLPLYVIQTREGDITAEEFSSLAGGGASGLLTVRGGDFARAVREKCNNAYMQNNLLELAKANKVVSYKTLQRVSKNGKTATVSLFDFRQTTALDAEDGKKVLGDVSRPDKRFSDVIGAEDAKDELSYFVKYLKNPKKFMRQGVKAPKGILLYGPPGTGKTLLAKAMAGESNVTFIATEGNRFLKKFVGEGPETVHEIFRAARKYAPSILFIDEIDVIARERGGDSTQAAYMSDVLTALLTEMDGFNAHTDKPVFVLAATNFGVEKGGQNSLDGAILRRFDRKIYVDLPNKEERVRFIKMTADKNPSFKISEEGINNIAVRSAEMSLAELEQVMELALRNSIKTEDFAVSDAVLEEAFEEYNSGEVKKWDKSLLERTARHEAGHALTCWLGGEKPSYLTIVARGSHGGYMQHGDSDGKALYTKKELLANIRTALGGRAAELVYYGDEDGISTGASSDLYSATKTAENLLCSYGMDEEAGLSYISLKDAAGSGCYGALREKVNGILKSELEKAKRQISENKEAINALVEILMERNHMRGEEIDEVFTRYAHKNND